MTIHWKLLSTAQKIEAVKSVYQRGMSGSQIAAHFEGATRNAVVGLFHRHAGKLGKAIVLRQPREVQARLATQKARRKDKRIIQEGAPEPHLCGRPLTLLSARQCRWAINNAAAGELHLFCGEPAEGSWCDHHYSRLVRRVSMQEG